MSEDGTWAFENVSFMIWDLWWWRHINKTTSKFHCESGKDSKLLLNNNSTFKMGCSGRQYNKGLLHLVNKKVLNGDYLNPCSFGEQYTIKKSWRNNTKHKKTSMKWITASAVDVKLIWLKKLDVFKPKPKTKRTNVIWILLTHEDSLEFSPVLY